MSGSAKRRPTLAQALVATFALIAIVLAVLVAAFYGGSRRALLLASQQVMREASARVAAGVEDHLQEAERVVASFEAKLKLSLVDAADPEVAARGLKAELAANDQVSQVELTHAQVTGFHERDGDGHDEGDPIVSREGRWQASARREGDDLAVRIVRADRENDPTTHLTFVTPASQGFRGRALWSDLWSPDHDRTRVVSVQKALWSSDERNVWVLRVTLLADRIDAVTRAVALPGHVVFLADDEGRLLSRLSAADRFVELDDAVRVAPASPPPALTQALATRLWGTVESGASAVDSMDVDGQRHLLTVTAFPDARTQGWRVGIVAPESLYLADLQARLRRLLLGAGALVALGIAGAALVLRATRRDLARLIDETTRLRSFDFAPSRAPRAAFRDVDAASESLEQAKTALRALGKYVPLGLVRQLYETRTEPKLGGSVQDVTLLFSDVEGFTTLSETLPMDVLADALGRYLEAMTAAVHASAGIIDKYTGDGVMAMWNAPVPCDGHPLRACEAVVACVAATDRLFASDAWAGQGLRPWVTRFGIHRANVSVGHFGAPDRLSYTAMGDGVNLAARLEGLNKQYGTRVLVSGAVEREARVAFDFRRIDRVAVKGKAEGVDVFELLGPRGARTVAADRYEAALAAYFDRRFAEAILLLGESGNDVPSSVLRARCVRFAASAPPPGWDGVMVATEK